MKPEMNLAITPPRENPRPRPNDAQVLHSGARRASRGDRGNAPALTWVSNTIVESPGESLSDDDASCGDLAAELVLYMDAHDLVEG
jgi:hypothetical protein